MLEVTCQPVDTVGVEDPELTMRQGDRDNQEDELVSRMLAILRSSGGRRFRELEHIHKLGPDIAGGKDDFDVGAGDQGILFEYAGDETGVTDVRSLMIALDAVKKSAILRELKLGAVVTAFRTSGFRSRSIRCSVISTAVREV